MSRFRRPQSGHGDAARAEIIERLRIKAELMEERATHWTEQKVVESLREQGWTITEPTARDGLREA